MPRRYPCGSLKKRDPEMEKTGPAHKTGTAPPTPLGKMFITCALRQLADFRRALFPSTHD
jgi:hypothetical protein